MIKGKRILGIIPARGGSKGVPDKNICNLGDRPLIAWTIDSAKKSKYLDKVIVSTDEPIIADIAVKYGADFPFQRPDYLATDEAKMIDVILHALKFYEKNQQGFDYFILLQPTSPFRFGFHIDEAIELIFDKQAKAVISVTETEFCPLESNTLPESGLMNGFASSVENTNRQEDPVYYRLNGAIFLSCCQTYLTEKTWHSGRTFAYIMDKIHSIDINDKVDFLLAQSYLDNDLIKEKN